MCVGLLSNVKRRHFAQIAVQLMQTVMNYWQVGVGDIEERKRLLNAYSSTFPYSRWVQKMVYWNRSTNKNIQTILGRMIASKNDGLLCVEYFCIELNLC